VLCGWPQNDLDEAGAVRLLAYLNQGSYLSNTQTSELLVQMVSYNPDESVFGERRWRTSASLRASNRGPTCLNQKTSREQSTHVRSEQAKA
jgi:hypothetical protein